MTLAKRQFFQSILVRLVDHGLRRRGVGQLRRKTDAPPPQGPMPVTGAGHATTKVPTRVEVMGQAEGARETEVRARVGGILLKRLYQEGEPVKAGQALFQIDRPV